MILNALSITMIFIGVISSLLAIWGGISSFILYRKWERSSAPEEKSSLEDRSYLVLLIMVIVLMIRLINWPLFYVTLQSFIPDIEGAMCIFGVTQVKPGLTHFLEFLKPINFFLIGGWFILHILDRATKTSPLMRRKFSLLSIISLTVLIDSIGDILLIFGITPESLVSCCTTVVDISSRPTRTSPESIFGPEYAQSLQVLFFFTHLSLMGFIGVTLKSKIFRRPILDSYTLKSENLSLTFSKKLPLPLPAGERGRVRGNFKYLWLGLLFLFSLLNAILFLLSQIEVFAPRMMNLPFHHCLYCLWQYVPDSILMFSFFILGTFSVGWGFTTDLFGKIGEASDLLPDYLRKIYWFAFFFLSASLMMLIIHLLVD